MPKQTPVRLALALAALLASQSGLAAPAAATPVADKAEVMLIGVFHFANPGRDMVKSRVIDVMTAENQAWLDGFAARLAAFKPTDVLIECSPAKQGQYDQQFKDYLAGKFALTHNENYQLGFRVAKRAGLPGVTCYDEDEIGWNAQPMFDYMDKHDPAFKQRIQASWASMGKQMDEEQATLPLARLLALTNDPARDAENKAGYLVTNAVDAGGGFAGADAAASWWHRNFRMYANIQKAAAPGRRVLAVGGQGHTAILKDLLALDEERSAKDVRAFIQAAPAD